MDSLTRMAFLTGNKEYQDIARRWANDILTHQVEDGYIGMYKPEVRFNHSVENGELWTMSRAMLAMLAYAEYTDDAKCLEAVKKAVALVMAKYSERHPYFKPGLAGGLTHGMAFVDVLEWLYRISGDEQYIRFASFLYEDYSKHAQCNRDFVLDNLLNLNCKFSDHGAHVAEQFMIPFFLANTMGTDRYKRAANNALDKFRFHHAPGGSINSVEAVSGKQGSADCLREYCTFKSFTLSLGRVAMITGNSEVADWVEKIVFNAAQGARFHPTLRAVEYCSSDNRVSIDEKSHGGRLMYSACHGAAPCCAVSAAQIMPYFVEGIWMRRKGGDELVAMQYGPCVLNTTVDGISLCITEETEYPFSDELVFKVDPEKDMEFTVSLRRPGHVEKIEVADISGATVSKGGSYVTIRKKWARGDVIRVRFTSPVKKVAQQESETVRGPAGGLYLQRGPLVYALKFPHEFKVLRELGDTGLKNYGVDTVDSTGWDYSIDPETEFTLGRDADGDSLHPWHKPPLRLKGVLVDAAGRPVSVSMVPMGCTVLRRVAFPVCN